MMSRLTSLAAVVLGVLVSGCAAQPQAAAPEPEAAAAPAARGSFPKLGDQRTTAKFPVLGQGVASWYGQAFHGKRTANGERFDMNAFTAAHPTLPFGTLVEVRNPGNGRTVQVRINDRGPFTGKRIIDLSKAAATALGLVHRGTRPVELRIASTPDGTQPQLASNAGEAGVAEPGRDESN